MKTIVLKSRPEADGTLIISIPEVLRGKELEVVVVLQPVDEADTAIGEVTDDHGWPVNFFEATYGSLAEDPIERLPQGELEVREAQQ